MRVAGMISGTSVDAIDIAVVDIDDAGWKLMEFGSNPYPANVREEILAFA